MKTTLHWLREYVDFGGSPGELAERLTMLGLEVEGVREVGGGFEGIVVAEVLTRARHPNADRLSVCQVNDGTGERQIVCGAQNFQPGDKVALITPGNALPPKAGEGSPFVIKVGRIRGVESHGMMCSAEELGLDPEAIGLRKEDGILILRSDARVGQAFAEYLGRGGRDVVFDLEVTPNRPDLNSVIGIAREIAAVTENPLRVPPLGPLKANGTVGELVAVRLDAPELCPRYTARVLRDVKVGPSPDWMRDRLTKVGLRSINNVVDVTNYVMLECGQPLHAFDSRLVAGDAGGVPTVIVRRAADGEAFVALDGKTHVLSRENLLIADPRKPIALAGVMGGQNSEIREDTTDVLLESACFAATNIRRTSKALGIRTESSYRFERGADIGMTDWASQRAAQLILETAGGALAGGVVDAYPTPVKPTRITLRHSRVNEVLGVALQPQEVEFHLSQLGLKAVNRRVRPVDDPEPPAPVVIEIPTRRPDLKREVDLIEEVVRLWGVDKVPATEPRCAKGAHPFDSRYDELMEVRGFLAGLGFDETQGQTLVATASARGVDAASLALVANPLSSDMDCLRPSLLPGLMDILRHNLHHKNGDLALFEIGRIFRRQVDGTQEGWRVALALTGSRNPAFWSGGDRDAKSDVYDLKGVIEELLEHLCVAGLEFNRRAEATEWFIESATATLGGGKRLLGEIGLLEPRLARRFDLRNPVALAELDLAVLLAQRRRSRSFRPVSNFPAVRRDVALVVPEAVAHDAVLAVVRSVKVPHLESVELFDVFRGGHVPAGHRSAAYAFVYRASDRTLTEAEANAAHERIVAELRKVPGASIRDERASAPA